MSPLSDLDATSRLNCDTIKLRELPTTLPVDNHVQGVRSMLATMEHNANKCKGVIDIMDKSASATAVTDGGDGKFLGDSDFGRLGTC